MPRCYGRGRDGSQSHRFSTQEEKSDKERWQHLADLADFALAMKDTLTNINNQSFNNFMLRIGKGSAGALSGPRQMGREGPTNGTGGDPDDLYFCTL